MRPTARKFPTPLAACAALFIFALACNLTAPAPATPGPQAARPLPAGKPDETLPALGELFDAQGRLPAQAARELFAGTVAPLPGVEPRKLPGENSTAAAEVALQVLARNRSGLPADVAAALDEALFGGVTREIDIPPAQSSSSLRPAGRVALADMRRPAPARDDLDTARALVEELRARIEARSGLHLSLPIRLGISTRPAGDIDAAATPVERGARLAACRVVYYPGTLEDAVRAEFVTLHELWHCFQYELAGLDDRGPWVDEGQAEWVAVDLATDASPAQNHWNNWLAAPRTALWRRSYDALGLYAAAAQAGFNPFESMIAMYGIGSNEAAVAHLFGDLPIEDALRKVAMPLTRTPDFGAEWDATGPGITATRATEHFPITLASQEAAADAGAFGSMPLDLEAGDEGDLLRISASGAGLQGAVEFPSAGPLQLEAGSSLLFCMRDEGCTCPDGSVPGGGEPPPAAGGRNGVATVASVEGGELRLAAQLLSLEDACRGLVGTWETTVPAVLATNLAPYGGVPAALSCEGPYTLTFGADGSFAGHFEATCRAQRTTATGSGSVGGSYTDQGDTFTLQGVHAVGSGEVQIRGLGMPIDLFNQFTSLTDPVPYSITGDQLTISFTTPAGNTLEYILQRAAP